MTRLALRILRSGILSTLIGCMAAYLGWQVGYGRGARDVFDLVMVLRLNTELPEPWNKGGI